MIDAERLRRSVEEMARVGATPRGGVHRPSLTDADRAARDLFAEWAGGAGLRVSIDDMGNMFARREGEDPNAAPALAGSHLDTVPYGGRFDGSLGVLAALEVVRAWNDRRVTTRRPVEVVNWTNEEGARFPSSMMGSAVFTGFLERERAGEVRDAEGHRVGDELERIGYRGELPCRPRPIGSYLELHVEQGPILIGAGTQIGVVEGIRGLRWLRLTMTGERDHAGPTPMAGRRDALVGAARAIAAIREIPGRLDPDLVTTVGEVFVSPNTINVIPEQVTFSADFRHPDPDTLEAAHRLVREAAEAAARGENLALEIEQLFTSAPVAFDPLAVGAVEAACRSAGFSARRMTSAAGHDARYLAEVCPTAMIFVPSVGGKSHSEDERTTWEDAARGAEVLGGALLALANRP